MKKTLKYLGLLVLGGLIILLSLGWYKKQSRENQPTDGYLNNAHVEFPQDRYTFLVGSDLLAGRRVITDNLWGYRYPSMEPLTPSKRGEFMSAYENTDWVKVAVRMRRFPLNPVNPGDSESVRREKMCFDWSVKNDQEPGKSSFLYEQDAYVRESGLYFGMLKKLRAPDDPRYERQQALGMPTHIYWDDSSGNACTYIRCHRYGAHPGENCQHLYVDTKDGLEFSMRYDSRLMPSWLDVQDKTIAIFNSFKK